MTGAKKTVELGSESVIIQEVQPDRKKEKFFLEASMVNKGMDEVSRCSMSVDGNTWSVSAWYTESEFAGKGFGKKCLESLVQYASSKHGEPEAVEYIWNGQNLYVHDWMERHFSPVSKCPIAVQKYQFEDDWDSHIYKLDVASFLSYFGVDKEQTMEL